MRFCRLVVGLCLILPAAPAVTAADLPAHRTLRILIVSDEVNPHGLPANQLTQPGDLSAALRSAGTGLNLDPSPDGVLEIATNDIEQATARLSVPLTDPLRYDVLIYFAHRIPNNGNNAAGRQQAFTTAVENFLFAGGGVIAFHHGSYFAAGKEGMLDLIGATANGAVPWDTVGGQNVIATAPTHFVACHAVEYTASVAYADAGRGVAAGTYPFFNNTPDERYPFFEYNVSAAGNVETLFGSNYNSNGTTHLVGFVHRRSQWSGRVVGYQPGEYQPNALDAVDGNNFQILANAIVFASGAIPADGLVLGVAPGPGSDEVTLSWAGCDGSFSVFRSTDPASIADPGNEIHQTTDHDFVDPAAGGTLHFYLVVRN